MRTVLFDLDGTLLPMQLEEFTKAYFAELTAAFADRYAPKKLIQTVLAGTEAMAKNDGSVKNAERFWTAFAEVYGQAALADIPAFDRFYENGRFQNAKAATQPTPLAAACIRTLKEKGYRLVLASNAVFPPAGMAARARWAGVDPADFCLITSYDVSSYCKPNLEYYREILSLIGEQAENCLMAGNSVREDLCAGKLGRETFLVTDCLEDAEGADLSGYRQGSMAELLQYLKALPEAEWECEDRAV